MEMIGKIFEKHKRAVMFFSGGKDSLALLLLCKPYWDRIDVVWVDTGDTYPEVRKYMERIKALVPNFITLHGDQPRFRQKFGLAVDMVPDLYSTLGQACFGYRERVYCSRFECCKANIWDPMMAYLFASKHTAVLRADRASERMKPDSNFIGETELFLPIWDWMVEDVYEFLKENGQGLVEERHMMEHGSSLDCMFCLAHSVEVPDRLAYLKKHHKIMYDTLKKELKMYKVAVRNELDRLKE